MNHLACRGFATPPEPVEGPAPFEGSPPLLVIVGPTAAGKTAFSLELVERLRGEGREAEVISADSRQIYRGMDIGTAKATLDERARVPHHLIDIVDPDQGLTLAEYQRMAYAAITAIHDRGRLPILVGGTGQYVHAVIEGWGIPEVAPNAALRAELEAGAGQHGSHALHARLTQLDPLAAGRIDHRNVRRVIRALEVCLATGQPISVLQTKRPPPYRILRLGVTRPRPALYARIDARIDRMIADGLEAEVRGLVARGCGWELPAMSGLGYAQFRACLVGEQTLAEVVALIKKQTRRFVHQQATWFRGDDPAIHWIEPIAMGITALDTVRAEIDALCRCEA